MKESHYFDFCLRRGQTNSKHKTQRNTKTKTATLPTNQRVLLSKHRGTILLPLPMTSTCTNRTSIAATLLCLLATISGTRAQAECVCSPRKYRVAFDLAQDCDSTNDIRGLPGIYDAFTFCWSTNVKKVTRVEIFEYDPTVRENKNKTFYFDPPVTNGTVDYTSVSNELQPGVSLEDQSNLVPFFISVAPFGNDEDGNPVRFSAGSSTIYYLHSPLADARFACDGTGPIEFNNSGLGYVRLVSIIISIYFV